MYFVLYLYDIDFQLLSVIVLLHIIRFQNEFAMSLTLESKQTLEIYNRQ